MGKQSRGISGKTQGFHTELCIWNTNSQGKKKKKEWKCNNVSLDNLQSVTPNKKNIFETPQHVIKPENLGNTYKGQDLKDGSRIKSPASLGEDRSLVPQPPGLHLQWSDRLFWTAIQIPMHTCIYIHWNDLICWPCVTTLQCACMCLYVQFNITFKSVCASSHFTLNYEHLLHVTVFVIIKYPIIWIYIRLLQVPSLINTLPGLTR